MSEGARRPGEDADDAEARERGAFLARYHDLDEDRARAVAYRELGYTAGPIARKLGVTEGTVKGWLDEIATEYGDEAVHTKWTEQRTGPLGGDRE